MLQKKLDAIIAAKKAQYNSLSKNMFRFKNNTNYMGEALKL
ncbi:hypothetical protein [Wolbachia endosymbiont of Litomosoides brasiliensis]|nr:hypothetical protein [Wolbachia endosymbiont of Litomosoides brasiliensis]